MCGWSLCVTVMRLPLCMCDRPASVLGPETDQALFQRRLQKALRSHPLHCYPASVKEFVRGLDGHISDNGRLKWSLLYTQVSGGWPADWRRSDTRSETSHRPDVTSTSSVRPPQLAWSRLLILGILLLQCPGFSVDCRTDSIKSFLTVLCFQVVSDNLSVCIQ